MEPKIYYNELKDDNGKPLEVTLTGPERWLAEKIQAEYAEKKRNGFYKNALGYEISITTLTTIMKKITEQKFFQLAPADYLPVRVGDGAFSTNLVTYRDYSIGDDFATGIVNLGTNNARQANIEAGVDSVTVQVKNWVKGMGWNIFDLEFAAKSGNWDIVTAKERARKKNWDLGIQKVAFLGLTGDSTANGLLTQPTTGSLAVTNNTTFLTTSIGALAGSPTGSPGYALQQFVQGILNVYRANCGRTAWPTHFTIPESDYLALAAASNYQFQLKSILQYLQETFQTMTGNKGFKILPCAYGDASQIAGTTGAGNATGSQIYALYNAAEESIRMDIPVDYTNTLANSLDNFNFQNAAYGQFTGVQVYRPAELLYFTFPYTNLPTPPL